MSRRDERQRRPALEPMEGRLAPSAMIPGGGPGGAPSGGPWASPWLRTHWAAPTDARGGAPGGARIVLLNTTPFNDDPHG
jgi:hypothetical protein